MHVPASLYQKMTTVDMPSLTFEQIKEIYYVVNVMCFVFEFFSLGACLYIKYILRTHLVFTAMQYNKFIAALVSVIALTGLVFVISLHKIIWYAYSNLTKWLEIFLLVFQMMSNNPWFAALQSIMTLLLIVGVVMLLTITSRIKYKVEHYERL